MEPPKKQAKVEDLDIKNLICTMQYTFFERLRKIEDKILKISSRCNLLEEKVEAILCSIRGVPAEKSLTISADVTYPECDNDIISQINMPTIEEYPDGSWLGDPENPQLCIRCHISPEDLEKVNESCSTAEKMSLTLLDYLFEREIQASSNISGTGKHGKKQLDPYKIFGIKCHVAYKFGITEDDWNRIKLNIDSKCRTQFRRKLKGMPLTIKGMKAKKNDTLKKSGYVTDQDSLSMDMSTENLNSDTVITKQETPSSIDDEGNEANLFSAVKVEEQAYSITFSDEFESQFIDTEHGRIQIIRATKEQFEQLKQNPHIEFLSETPFT